MAKASAAWKQPINGRCIPMGNPPSIWTMSGIYRKWKPPSAAHVKRHSIQSPNKENAFHFLQMLLEDNWKNTAVETVRKDINRELLEGLEMQYTREQVTVDGECIPA